MRRGLTLPAAVLAAAALAAPASAASPDVVISEVYGGGGNSGATYKNDFVELQNRGTAAVDLTGWSVQYASATGTGWARTNLSGSIAPGRSYLVQQGSGAGGTQDLPAPDATGTIAMSATAGKVALVTSSEALTCGADCDAAAGVRDFVGYGSANDFEKAAATGVGNTASASRVPGPDTDDNAADFTAGSPDPQNGQFTPPPPPPPPAEVGVHDVQGAGHRSPLEGDTVSVTGVVTALRSNGFYLQDPEPDADPRTSEGVFVFTRSAPSVAVGAAVRVVGAVSEFRPGGSGGQDNLTTTQLTSSAAQITPAGTGEIAPTVIGAGGRVPPTTVIDNDSSGDVEATPAFDPEEDGIDSFESLEGMLTEVREAVAVGPTSDFGEIPVLADGGAGAGLRTPRGGIVIRPTDFNPERIVLDDEIARPAPTFDVGDRFAAPVRAVVDYGFGNFKFQALAWPATEDGGLQREVTAEPKENQLAVASFNVENLDPTDPADKFGRLAETLVTNLRAPDLVALEEVQDNDGAARSGVTDASLTYERLIAAIEAAGGPRYEYRQIDPTYNQDGGEPGGNIRVGFLFRTDRGLSFVDRPGGDATTATQEDASRPGAQLTLSPGRIDPTDPAFANSRKPLAGEFRYRGRALFVIANHFGSKGGDDPLFGRVQPPVRSSEVQRHKQAAVVNGFVEDLLEADPRANIVVLGDINDFEFSRTTEILEGDGDLLSLIRTLPQPERYTYVFEGNSQVLDQILVSQNLLAPKPEYDSVHVNAEFADQVSDHDPQVALLRVTGALAPD